MKNEQIDFNSYVFKKYYHPKGKANQREVNEKTIKSGQPSIQCDSTTVNSAVIEKVRERVDKSIIDSHKEIGVRANDEINRKIIDEINEEMEKSVEEQKRNRQEEYRKVLNDQIRDKEKEKEKSIEYNKSLELQYTYNSRPNTLVQSKQNNNNDNDLNSKNECLDDFELLKLEKAKERQKKIEYSKILQEQIEEQKRYKENNNQTKNHGRDRDKAHNDLKPLYVESSNTMIDPSNIHSINNFSIPSCKTPHETQQFISTYANLLSNFCDSKMERYQNTQMLFKPYEKMLNDMVDVKINQLASQSLDQDDETIFKSGPIQRKAEFEKDSIEVVGDNYNDNGTNKGTGSQLRSGTNNANKKVQLKKANEKKALKNTNSMNKGIPQRNTSLTKGRLLQTAEQRIRNNQSSKHYLSLKKTNKNIKTNVMIKSNKPNLQLNNKINQTQEICKRNNKNANKV